jgi:hypothetical protein
MGEEGRVEEQPKKMPNRVTRGAEKMPPRAFIYIIIHRK